MLREQRLLSLVFLLAFLSQWHDWGKLGGSRQAGNVHKLSPTEVIFLSKLKASSQFYEKQRLCNHYTGACVRRCSLSYMQHDLVLVLMFLMIESEETEHLGAHFRVGFAAKKSSEKPTWNKFYL